MLKYLTLAVLLAVMQTMPPVPRQTANAGRGSSQSVKGNASNDQGQPIAPSVVQTVSPKIGTNGSENISKNDKDKPIRVSELPPMSIKSGWRDNLTLFFAGALVGIGAYGVWMAKKSLKVIERQAVSMSRQTTHLRKSVIYARRSAIAAKKSADNDERTVKLSQRADVLLKDFEVRPQSEQKIIGRDT